MPQPLKIIFAGTPDFAAKALAALLSTEQRIVAVYTQPDRPSGRGRKVQFSPVKQLAVDHGLAVHQPKTLKDPQAQQILAGHQADLMIVVAYGLLLPQAVLDAPRLGCINIHASLLPRWRGAAPIQRALLAGDPETGVTIMQMEAGLDTGPMLSISKTPIGKDETGGSLHDRLAELGAEALLTTLPGISDGSLKGVRQDDALASYANKLDKEEARIDWTQSSVTIDRKIRAFNPWPVAECIYRDKVMRIWRSEVLPDGTAASPGAVVNTGKTYFDVATGNGLLRVSQLQMPGKRAMSAGDFLNAHTMDGVVLG
jgi:methionyl-tRNA formyltransferase